VNATPPNTETEGATGAGADAGMRVLAELMAGLILYGGLGWLGDHLLHTGFLLPVGLLVGFALSIYGVFRRYGGVKR